VVPPDPLARVALVRHLELEEVGILFLFFVFGKCWFVLVDFVMCCVWGGVLGEAGSRGLSTMYTQVHSHAHTYRLHTHHTHTPEHTITHIDNHIYSK
jgi:hypothetical protein